MTENELSVAAYYCRLFAEQQQQQQQQQAQSTTTRSETESEAEAQEDENDNDNNNNNVTTRNYWVHDTWTDSDLRSAKALLDENLEKCSVSVLDRDDGMDDGDAWNRFYSNHGTRFFKDRHYLERDFVEDFTQDPDENNDKKSSTLVEIGCGVGNTILPMLEEQENGNETTNHHHHHVQNSKILKLDIVHGLDISQEAIELMKQDPRFIKANAVQRAYGHVCDITQSAPAACIGKADIATLLFCLSAIDPDIMPTAAQHVASILKPGGVLLFRDYGRFDEAQLKLGMSRNKRLKENFYRKHDGTKCFYFTLKDLEKLFTDVGLEVLELSYIQRVYDNLKSGEKRRRVWVHARFKKPPSS